MKPAEWTRRPSGLYVPAEERRPTAVDLFCGCGGFSLGLFEAGFDVLAGVDWDCDAAETYMVNLGAYPIDLRFVTDDDRSRFARHLSRHVQRSARRNPAGIAQLRTSGANCVVSHPVPVFWLGDIRQLSGEALLESIGLEVGELDLVVGGPPCQGYSMAGRRNVMDPRNSLVFEFARLVCEMKPRTFCMENVPGMLSMVTETGASVVDELCRVFERGEYGEYESMRRVLTGDRKMVSRGAGQRAKPRRRAAEPASTPAQRGLFDDLEEARNA